MQNNLLFKLFAWNTKLYIIKEELEYIPSLQILVNQLNIVLHINV